MSAVITEVATDSYETTTSFAAISTAITDVGKFTLHFDMTNLADGELLQFRVQENVTSGGSAISSHERIVQNAQTSKIFVYGPFKSLHSITFQVKRVGGSASFHDFTIYKEVDDAVPSNAGDAMDLVANAVDSTSIASAAITSAKFGVSAITNNVIAPSAIGASELATDAVNEIRDSILSDGTTFAGANIDAAISSRAVAGDSMALTAAAIDAIWEELTGVSRTAGSFGQAVIDILEDVSTTIPATLTTIEGKIDTIDTEVGAIQADVTLILEDTGVTIPALIAALPTAAGIADAVWIEQVGDHDGVAGSTAEALSAAAGGGGGGGTFTASDRVTIEETQALVAKIRRMTSARLTAVGQVGDVE